MLRLQTRRLSGLHNSLENVNALLESNDRSSYLIAQYVPEPARNAFLAIRAFNLEVNKISDGGGNSKSIASKMSASTGISSADIKFKFWSDQLDKVFQDKEVNEPVAILLQDSLRKGLNLEIEYFQKFLQTRRHFLKARGFNNVNDICSYGEGTYSQLNYMTQALLLLPLILPSAISLLEESTSLQGRISDIAAHLGQATAVGAMILGANYYASRNHVTLPVDLMTKFDLSQEELLRLTQGHIKDKEEIESVKEKVKSVVYETAVVANDHIITARTKLKESQEEIAGLVRGNKKFQARKWRRNLPDVIFTPFMVGIPTVLYLQKLEKYDFDVLHPKLQQKEWRLAWVSFRDYHLRRI